MSESPVLQKEGPCDFSFACSEYHAKCQATLDALREVLMVRERRMIKMKIENFELGELVKKLIAEYEELELSACPEEDMFSS